MNLIGKKQFIYYAHFVICDNEMTKLNKRKLKYHEFDDKFGFSHRSESNSSETKIKFEKCLNNYCGEIKVFDYLMNLFGFKHILSLFTIFANVCKTHIIILFV